MKTFAREISHVILWANLFQPRDFRHFQKKIIEKKHKVCHAKSSMDMGEMQGVCTVLFSSAYEGTYQVAVDQGASRQELHEIGSSSLHRN